MIPAFVRASSSAGFHQLHPDFDWKPFHPYHTKCNSASQPGRRSRIQGSFAGRFSCDVKTSKSRLGQYSEAYWFRWSEWWFRPGRSDPSLSQPKSCEPFSFDFAWLTFPVEWKHVSSWFVWTGANYADCWEDFTVRVGTQTSFGTRLWLPGKLAKRYVPSPYLFLNGWGLRPSYNWTESIKLAWHASSSTAGNSRTMESPYYGYFGGNFKS